MIFDELWRGERRARRTRKQIEAEYKPQIEAAKQRHDESEHGRLVSGYLSELDCNDEPDVIRTERLVRRARKLGLPIPPKPHIDGDALAKNKAWVLNQYSGNFTLSDEAGLELTRAVRREEKERLEHQMRWVTGVVLPIIGLIGTLMAAISLIHALWPKK